jgi:hypothetical protein
MRPQTLFRPSSGQPEVTQSHSAARLAAEAFFSQSPSPSELVSGEVAIVRPEARSLSPEEASSPPPAGSAEGLRSPTVHRLPSGSIEPTEPFSSPQHASASVVSPAALDEQAAGLAAPARIRKKRRQLHGEVTIIRAAEVPKAPEVSQPGMQSGTSPSFEPARSAPAALASHKPAVRASLLMDYVPRYPKLIAQIKALEVAAQQAKRREAIEAVRWIKRAIRAHGLTPQDLGLR